MFYFHYRLFLATIKRMNRENAYTELKVQVERVTYFNEENSYAVAKAKVQGRSNLVTIVGTFFSITPGETLMLKGHWATHSKYGEQFKTVSYESLLPATTKGIERYLGSGMIKGIGPVMAKRLVGQFGDKTLAIIDNEIKRLHEVPGIGEKRIEMIAKAWEEQRDIRDVMVFLQGNGVSPAYAVRIYRQYGNDAMKIVSENPYRLATDIFGIGFLTADKIAAKLGIDQASGMRIEAGILYVLNGLADDGHVFFPPEPLQKKCAEILEVEEELIAVSLKKLEMDKRISLEYSFSASTSSATAVYLTAFYIAEKGIAAKLKTLVEIPKQLRLVNIEEATRWVQKDLNISFSDRQLSAVKASTHNKMLVITGGPGTGKTTIINAIIRIAHKLGQRVLLAAPTGRAAKRMTETTGQEAKTIHRLLEYSFGGESGGGFKRNEENPLEADLIIIDEVSMVDTLLMYHFLKAVPLRSTLILVGDVDQLPSVGPGNVLKDIIDSGAIETIRLNEIFRQSEKSMIIVNAHRINHGEMPVVQSSSDHLHDFHFTVLEDPEEVLNKIVNLCKEVLPLRFGLDPVNDIQVLTPMHRGTIGVTSLNNALQRELNPNTDEIARGGRTFKVGDKVLQIRNNYDKDVYNGDIGRIKAIDKEVQEIKVDYEGKIVAYEYSEIDEIVLAYAVSVHKSQGSEYPAVIIPVLTQHYLLLQRNLLYTGITRGKKLVVLVGTRKALAIAVKNNKQQQRYTLLRERLTVKS